MKQHLTKMEHNFFSGIVSDDIPNNELMTYRLLVKKSHKKLLHDRMLTIHKMEKFLMKQTKFKWFKKIRQPRANKKWTRKD